ncbi:MAG: radical SAM protein, partial [Firmicutes bacterium]|nr:radical SAM protein [Bacillota bacterium]
TNGSMLTPARVTSLVSAGLDRVTVSLDALDADIFAQMNGVGYPVARVLAGIDAAVAAGLPVKINMVVKRGVNDRQILPMAAHFRHTGIRLRLIEFMDVGNTNGWRMDDVVTADEMLDRIRAVWPLVPVNRQDSAEVAMNYRYADGAGEVGVISSVSHPFCGACSRLRLSTDGKVYSCLFAAEGCDLKPQVRDGTDAELQQALIDLWRVRRDRYSEERGEQDVSDGHTAKVEMSRIGG